MDDTRLIAAFADELAAHQYFEKLLWPDGAVCPRCHALGRVRKLNGESTRIGTYKCYGCRKIFSLTYGTLLHGTHVPLHKWLQAIYLTDAGARRIRPHHLQRILNVSFKTASGMLRRLENFHSGSAPVQDPAPPERKAEDVTPAEALPLDSPSHFSELSDGSSAESDVDRYLDQLYTTYAPERRDALLRRLAESETRMAATRGHLAQVEQQLFECAGRINRQRKVVAELACNGVDTGIALGLLATFEQLHQALEQHQQTLASIFEGARL